jgi:hypothetical protein
MQTETIQEQEKNPPNTIGGLSMKTVKHKFSSVKISENSTEVKVYFYIETEEHLRVIDSIFPRASNFAHQVELIEVDEPDDKKPAITLRTKEKPFVSLSYKDGRNDIDNVQLKGMKLNIYDNVEIISLEASFSVDDPKIPLPVVGRYMNCDVREHGVNLKLFD